MNTCPALDVDCPADCIKRELVHSMTDLVFHPRIHFLRYPSDPDHSGSTSDSSNSCGAGAGCPTRLGKFAMCFPFSERVEEMTLGLEAAAQRKNKELACQEFIREIVNEIKAVDCAVRESCQESSRESASASSSNCNTTIESSFGKTARYEQFCETCATLTPPTAGSGAGLKKSRPVRNRSVPLLATSNALNRINLRKNVTTSIPSGSGEIIKEVNLNRRTVLQAVLPKRRTSDQPKPLINLVKKGSSSSFATRSTSDTSTAISTAFGIRRFARTFSSSTRSNSKPFK